MYIGYPRASQGITSITVELDGWLEQKTALEKVEIVKYGAKRVFEPPKSVAQCRFLGRTEGVGPMALTAVSRLVVVDGDSFLNALFASAGQDRRAMEHRPQDRGPRRRTIDWQLDERGALEARLGNVFNDLQTCNSNLICSL